MPSSYAPISIDKVVNEMASPAEPHKFWLGYNQAIYPTVRKPIARICTIMAPESFAPAKKPENWSPSYDPKAVKPVYTFDPVPMPKLIDAAWEQEHEGLSFLMRRANELISAASPNSFYVVPKASKGRRSGGSRKVTPLGKPALVEMDIPSDATLVEEEEPMVAEMDNVIIKNTQDDDDSVVSFETAETAFESDSDSDSVETVSVIELEQVAEASELFVAFGEGLDIVEDESEHGEVEVGVETEGEVVVVIETVQAEEEAKVVMLEPAAELVEAADEEAIVAEALIVADANADVGKDIVAEVESAGQPTVEPTVVATTPAAPTRTKKHGIWCGVKKFFKKLSARR